MKLLLSIFLLFTLALCNQNEKSPKKIDYEEYLKNRFNYEINKNTRIKYRKKQNVYDSLFNILKEPDSIKKVKINRFIDKFWPSGISEFIDTLYTVHPNDTTVKHGLFLSFNGDSTYYTAGMYKDGLKDSMWSSFSIKWGKVTVPYKNDKKNGIETILFPQGGKSIDNYLDGTIVDTSLLYYASGKIEKKTIFKNDKIFKVICYEENGYIMDCQEQYMR